MRHAGAIGRAAPTAQRISTAVAVALALMLAMALIPLWSVDVPPLMDYHNHLARQYILRNLPASEQLQTYYQADWRVAPYLAMDVIVQGLAIFMPVDLAGRLFLSLALVLFALSPIALSLAVNGQVTPWALLGLLMVHNETLSLGFVHYLFSVGFGMCALAAWIRWRESVAARLMWFPLVSMALFFSHLIGFCIYALLLCSYELAQFRSRLLRVQPAPRRVLGRSERITLASLGLQFLSPLAIFFAFGPPATVVSQNVYGGLGRKLHLLLGSFDYLMPPYLWALERHLVWLVPGALLVALILRRTSVAKSMVLPVVAIFALFMITPWSLFGGFGADHRLLPAIGVLLAGSLTWRRGRIDEPPENPRRAVADQPSVHGHRVSSLLRRTAPSLPHLAVGGLVLARIFAITVEWRQADIEYAGYLRALAALPDGAKLYFAFSDAGAARQRYRPKYSIPLLAVAKRGVYVPFLFTSNSNPGINIRYTDSYEALQYLSPGPKLGPGQQPTWERVVATYDYVLIGGEQHLDNPPPGSLAKVHDGSNFALYRVIAPRRQSP